MVVLAHFLLDVGIARIHNLGELFSRPIVQRDNNKIFLGDRQGAISPSLYVEQADLIRQRWGLRWKGVSFIDRKRNDTGIDPFYFEIEQ